MIEGQVGAKSLCQVPGRVPMAGRDKAKAGKGKGSSGIWKWEGEGEVKVDSLWGEIVEGGVCEINYGALPGRG
jgi:hypothetical protein